MLYGQEDFLGLSFPQHKILLNPLSANLRLFLAHIIPPGDSLLLQSILDYVFYAELLEKGQPNCSWQRE